MKAFNFVLDLAFRKWLQGFLKRIAKKHPDWFIELVDDLDLKPIVKKIVIDKYMNDFKFENYDYISDRAAKSYHKLFLDEFISRQRIKK